MKKRMYIIYVDMNYLTYWHIGSKATAFKTIYFTQVTKRGIRWYQYSFSMHMAKEFQSFLLARCWLQRNISIFNYWCSDILLIIYFHVSCGCIQVGNTFCLHSANFDECIYETLWTVYVPCIKVEHPLYTSGKVFIIIPEFTILRVTFLRKSTPNGELCRL